MCARLLACPLCSQPGFQTVDSLRSGLISAATRPLACPVCNEVLLGIDKLTIHLFGHTQPEGNWSLQEATRNDEIGKNRADIYVPIDGAHTFSSLTDGNSVQIQNISAEIKESSQVIVLQNVSTTSDMFSTNLIDGDHREAANIFEATATATTNETTEASTPMDQTCKETSFNEIRANESSTQNDMELSSIISHDNNNSQEDQSFSQTWPETSESSKESFAVSHTDRLAELVKSSQIAASPLGTYHESYDCSRPKTPADESPSKPLIKSSRIIPMSEKTERCNICGLHFPDRNILILHKQFLHKIKEKDSNLEPEDLMKNFPCHLCTKVFKMRGSLMVHMRVAHPNSNTVGKLAEPVKQAIKLRVQLSMQNPKEQTPEQAKEIAEKLLNFELEEGYNCPTCGKNFKKEQHVIQHIKTHEGKQWECDVCTKMFTTKYFLKKHKRLHSGEMPYKCNLCDKTFTFQQSYHKHRMYHKDEKPHSCQTCGRSFKELSTLHNHERIHTGEKPFACETCGKCFRQRVSYLVHQRIHTGAMPYQCTICGRNFRYKVSQRTHRCLQQSPEAIESEQANFNQNSTKPASEIPLKTDPNPNASEENQYVFVLNDKGEHVLKRKSEIESTATESGKDNKLMPDLWDENLSNGMKFNQSGSDNLFNGNGPGTSHDSSSDHDLFSMINEISSPSAEMKDLRLSSPVSEVQSEIAENSTVRMNSNFDNGCISLSALQNINEDSLKELLNSISEK